jgi:single-strand DNA-binding protein
MAHTLNRAELIGFLGQDPELRYTGSGTAVCDLRIATDESYTRDGERVEQTEWHNVTCWAGLAETVAENLSTGARVYVCGPMETNEWELEGEEFSERYINADEVIFLGGEGDSGGPSNGQSRQSQSTELQQEDGQTFEPDDELPF